MKKTNYIYWIVSVYVLVIYAYYPHDALSVIPHTLYQYLTEGFLSGHLHLLVAPPSELLNLADPYVPKQHGNIGLWDASLFQGKYYIYFGPLPVIVFYIPFKLVTGFYPPDALVVFFFLSIGFLVGFLLMIKIKKEYFPRMPEWQLFFAGSLMGFANGAPYLLAWPVVYQVAISSAFCLINFALFFLYELVNHRSKVKNAFLFSLCLSLSVAGRPHFALLCVFLIPGVLLYLLKQNSEPTGHSRTALVIALLVPCISMGVILGLYNYLRFGSLFDFGQVWQISQNDMRDYYDEVFQLTKIVRNIIFGFYFYFLKPFGISATFPYVFLPYHSGSIPINKDYFVEAIGGVLTTAPFILMILGLPKYIMVHLKKKSPETTLCWFLLFACLIPLILALFLISLPMASQRYEMDFLPWFVMLSVISFWLLIGHSKHLKGFKIMQALFFTTGIYSVYIGWAIAIAFATRTIAS